ncbi:MAG: helix-turn-helix domain-containing protein [Verrucomicrobiales bacterium]|nr:helix-turn-helix domain-containing protein [Verrucomicrobiales bacterium]
MKLPPQPTTAAPQLVTGAASPRIHLRNASILSQNDSIMTNAAIAVHPVLAKRQARGWTQADLAQRAGISRAAVSAIEGATLNPSVTAALSLAEALGCSVEELFGQRRNATEATAQWAWQPRGEPCRFWEAEVDQRRLLFPVEATHINAIRHDGVWHQGVAAAAHEFDPARTLVLACCDPAAGLLASEYARESGFRLLVLPRGTAAALDLLSQRLVHVAGLHRSTSDHPDRNPATVQERLGTGYRLVRAADWQEGVALPGGDGTSTATSLLRKSRRWAARERGSAARECLDDLLGNRDFEGREVDSHAAVAEAVHAGWAEAGICVRLCADEAGLNFLPLRTESLDLCFPAATQHDPRLQALVRLLKHRAYRRMVSELPGYDARHTGESLSV